MEADEGYPGLILYRRPGICGSCTRLTSYMYICSDFPKLLLYFHSSNISNSQSHRPTSSYNTISFINNAQLIRLHTIMVTTLRCSFRPRLFLYSSQKRLYSKTRLLRQSQSSHQPTQQPRLQCLIEIPHRRLELWSRDYLLENLARRGCWKVWREVWKECGYEVRMVCEEWCERFRSEYIL